MSQKALVSWCWRLVRNHSITAKKHFFVSWKPILYISGFRDNGVSSFSVYKNGKFKNVNNIDDNTLDRCLTRSKCFTDRRFCRINCAGLKLPRRAMLKSAAIWSTNP